MTDWAAKVLEGVPRFQTLSGNLLSEADALAAIASMGAGDGLVERLLARKGRGGGFKHDVEDGVNVLTHEPAPDPLCQEAAAHIAALTAQVAEAEREKDRVADINRNLCNSHNILLVDGSKWQRRAEAAEAEAADLRARVARLEGALFLADDACAYADLYPELLISPDGHQKARAALTNGGKDG